MDIFVYGTLTEPEQVGRVVDSFAFLGPAVLSGLHPVQGEYPTLAPGGETGGRLLRTDEVAALDSYEGVDESQRLSFANQNPEGSGDVDENQRFSSANQKSEISDDVDDGLYTRISVPLAATDPRDEDTVAVYVGDPSRLEVEESVDWPGDANTEPFDERVERYLREHDVRVHPRRE